MPALFGVQQDATGHARDIALSYAKGIGATRAGVIETTFKEKLKLTYSVNKLYFVGNS